jgi:hypothetical protein
MTGSKQRELLNLCHRTILGQVRREVGYEGSAAARTGPDANSSNARFIDLRFWKPGLQMEIPLEITQMNAGGGGSAVLEAVLRLLTRVLPQ